jgi:hypothetical protein
MGFPIIRGPCFSVMIHSLCKFSNSFRPQHTYNTTMGHVQIPDQSQFNNLWLALFPQGLVPEVNNPWMEQGPTAIAGQIHGECNVKPHYDQNFEQHNHNTSCTDGMSTSQYGDLSIWGQKAVAERVFLGDSYLALQNPLAQEGTIWSINDAIIQPYQEVQGIEGAIPNIQYAYRPHTLSYAPSGGTGLASVLHGPPAVPATMVVAATEHHYHLSLPAMCAHPPPNGLIQLRPSPANSTQDSTKAGGAAYSSSFNGFSLINPWAMPLDVSGQVAQEMAPQMDTVTPCVDYGGNGGGTSIGAANCADPGPPRTINRGARRITFTSDRNDAGRCHRSLHRAIGCGTRRCGMRTRYAIRPSRSGATRGPAVQFEADASVLATRLLNEGAEKTAVDLLRTEIFISEMTIKALMAKSIYREQSTSTSSMRSKYRLLLGDTERDDGSKGHCCLLCPQGGRKVYKNPQDSIRHLCKSHFGIALSCIGRWYVAIFSSQNMIEEGLNLAPSGRKFYRQSEMNQHLKKCQVNLDQRSSRPGRPAPTVLG